MFGFCKELSVTIFTDVSTNNCPPDGKEFKVTATVKAVTENGACPVKVSFYESRLIDRLIDQDEVTVGPGAGTAAKTFLLKCKGPKCVISGNKGTSKENEMEGYVYAEDASTIGVLTAKSSKINLSCVPIVPDDDDLKIKKIKLSKPAS